MMKLRIFHFLFCLENDEVTYISIFSGNSAELIEKLMRDHKNETEALRASQQRNREKQLRKLQDRLEENREQWSQRKEAEKMEQEQLRQYEDNVVRYVASV